MEKQFNISKIKQDDLNELVVEEKKKKRGWFFLLMVLLFLAIIFCTYSVYAPVKKTLAFEGLPSIVYQSETVIRGINAEPGSRLKLVVNYGEPLFLVADEEGKFSAKIELNKGENMIEVSTINEGDQQKVVAVINYLVETPILEITSPQNNSEFSVPKGVGEKEIEVVGKTKEGVKVSIGGSQVEVDNSGNFEAKIKIKLGDNTILVVADNGGNKTESNITVKLVESSGGGNQNGSGQSDNNSADGSESSGSSSESGNSNSDNNQDGGQVTEPELEPIVIYPSKVIISYIAYSNDPSISGYGEYIELKNTGGEDKDITGWMVYDGDGNTFVFPGYILSPGATVRITTNTGRFVFNSTSPVWARIGEPGYLKDASGRLVDVYSY